MTPQLRRLIVGGYGTFGGRLVELLAGDSRLTLLVAGRSMDLARTYCARRSAAVSTLFPSVFDRVRSGAKELAGDDCCRREWAVPSVWRSAL